MHDLALNFETLASEHYDALTRFAFRLCQNSETARDLAQEAFLLALERQDQLRNPARAKSWLFTILYREFLQKRRHDTRFPEHSLHEDGFDLPTHSDSPGDSLDASLAVRLVGSLDESHRVPVEMFYLKDRSYQEIATSLNIPIGTVMSRLSRAKTMLRESLGELACGTRKKLAATPVQPPRVVCKALAA